MFRRKSWVLGLGAMILMLSAGVGAQLSGTSHRLTIDDLIDIKHPSNPVWSPDGRHIAFVWERAGVGNFYLANADGSGVPVALTSFPNDGGVPHGFWSPSGDVLYFPHEGRLWQVPVAGGQPHPVGTANGPEAEFASSPDGTRVAFVRTSKGEEQADGSDLVVRSLADQSESVLVHEKENIERPLWSPDGTRLAYTAGNQITHHDQSPAYSGDKLIFRADEYKPGQLFVIPAAGGHPLPIGTAGEFHGVAWIDNSHLTFERQSDNYKTRTIYVADITTGARAIHEDKEEKFWSLPDWEANAGPQPSPDGEWIAFLTDLDGWDHLYVIPAQGGNAVQITKGHFEAWRPAWSHDSKRIAFDANQTEHPGDRRIGIASIDNNPTHAVVTYVTTGLGTNIEPQWSPDDKYLVYQHTDTRNCADLFVTAAVAGAKPLRLSDSMPSAIDRSALVEPQLVHYPGPDGRQVPAWLFVPKNLDRTKKHAAIIWVHGDGINQNYDGWHVQRNYAVYYSYHQYLLQQGYVVLAPDYRGSIGYGRDWRNGVYMDVGGNDAKDAWMGAYYLKTLPYVDANRVGIWGLSYGGFFTLIAMTDQPTLFRAGVDVAGVVDYRMYYSDPFHGDWTVGRIGTPEQNPTVYDLASPISRISQLARPLLVLHGTADVNVPFLESVWLMDEAVRNDKGNLVEFMMYPGEFHYFRREHVLRDSWKRVDEFFATHLEVTNTP